MVIRDSRGKVKANHSWKSQIISRANSVGAISVLVDKLLTSPQGPEEMFLSLEHQNPSKTSEKTGYFDRVSVSLHIL